MASVYFLDWIDCNSNGDEIILFVREHIPATLISSENLLIQGFYVEINLRQEKWLISCSYNPKKCNISKHAEALSKSIDLFFSNYDYFLLKGDLNIGLDDTVMKDFCNLYSLENPVNPSCI